MGNNTKVLLYIALFLNRQIIIAPITRKSLIKNKSVTGKYIICKHVENKFNKFPEKTIKYITYNKPIIHFKKFPPKNLEMSIKSKAENLFKKKQIAEVNKITIILIKSIFKREAEEVVFKMALEPVITNWLNVIVTKSAIISLLPIFVFSIKKYSLY